MAGCSRQAAPAPASLSSELRIGFGVASGQNTSSGSRQAIRNISSEGLLASTLNGRSEPWLAKSWTLTDDGRLLKIQLRPEATFHDGTPVDAATVVNILSKALPGNVGNAYADVEQISEESPTEIAIRLKQRSNFILEGLDAPIDKPGRTPISTGPFVPKVEDGSPVMVANDTYYAGKPTINRIVFKDYSSVRAAWADLLRDGVDVLYEVGMDAVDSLQRSTQTKVVSYQRSYAYMLVMNVAAPKLRSVEVRRALNGAIDRDRIVNEVLAGHGTPAVSPVRPLHWAYDTNLPRFSYNPVPLSDGKSRLQLTCLLGELSLERLALEVQSQLNAVGVDLKIELVPLEAMYQRLNAGSFDMLLADVTQGPTMARPSLFWATGAANNWGSYSNPQVDEALNQMQRASNDDTYRAAVGAYQRAMVDDPPAVFLAWSERARAVSTRFEVPADPEHDILRNLRLWRPLAAPGTPPLN